MRVGVGGREREREKREKREKIISEEVVVRGGERGWGRKRVSERRAGWKLVSDAKEMEREEEEEQEEENLEEEEEEGKGKYKIK